ncbi:unnamed protein product [Periconia digitata]|uniref:Uncharacterized protein n=1 Tax=Periconia digitata TaxID=1303443 RepID=A0A9W4U9U3_9PLEO|nr:unnamed protein product [Periconia digitata]
MLFPYSVQSYMREIELTNGKPERVDVLLKDYCGNGVENMMTSPRKKNDPIYIHLPFPNTKIQTVEASTRISNMKPLDDSDGEFSSSCSSEVSDVENISSNPDTLDSHVFIDLCWNCGSEVFYTDTMAPGFECQDCGVPN